MEPNEREAQVLRLAARGFRLFPCRRRSKIPQIKAWQDKATCDVAQLSQWFQKFPGCNWAVACGEGSGLWVLDIDSDPAGAAMMRRFQEQGYIGPETLCVRTGREFAYHLYFLHPNGARIANKAGIKGWHEDLDVRGDGGYAMVPPSIWTDDPEKAKAEGREMRPATPYMWLQGDGCAIAEAPAWLIEAITEKKPTLEHPRFTVLERDEGPKAART
jgi:bifunctional DNA primase/polymerase-like protein